MDSPFILVLTAGLFVAVFDRYSIWQLSTLLSHYGKIPVYDARRKLDADRIMKRRLLPLCVMPLLAPVTRMDKPLLLAGAAVFVALLIAYCMILYRGWRSGERA